MPDLERLDAAVVGVARLHRRDHAARFIAQRARVIEIGVVIRANEIAVALDQRQFVGERRAQAPAPVARAGCRIIAAALAISAAAPPCVPARASTSSAAAMPSRMAARSRGPPRSTHSRARARAISGAARSTPRRSSRAGAVGDTAHHGVEPLRNRGDIGQRSGEPLRQQPRAGRGHGCGRWWPAASRAARPTAFASIRDWRASPDRSPSWRRPPRATAATVAGAGRAACVRHR